MLLAKAIKRRLNPRKELREIARIRRGFERSLESRLKRLFEDIAKEASSNFSASGSINVSETDIVNRLSQILLPFYREILSEFSNYVQSRLGLKAEFDDLIRGYMLMHGGQRIRGISLSYRNSLMQVVRRGAESGVNSAQISRDIEAAGLGLGRARAATIARTEIHSASTYANHEMSVKYMPAGTMKQWVSTSDERTRPHHRSMNGQQVPIDKPFKVTTNGIVIDMDYCGDPKGGPSNVINCRCQTIYIAPDDEVEEDDLARTKPVTPPVIAREKIDLEELPNVRGWNDEVKAEATKVLNNRPDPIVGNAIAKVLRLNKGKVQMNRNGNTGFCAYFFDSPRLQITSNPFESNGSITVHEWGHAIDRFLGYTDKKFTSGRDGKWLWSQGDEFTEAMLKDRKALGIYTQGRATAKYREDMKELYTPLLDKYFPKKTNKFGVERYDFSGSDRDGNFSDIIDALFAGTPHEDANIFGHGVSYYRGEGNVQAEMWANMADMYGSDHWNKVLEVAPNAARVFEEKIKEFAR